MILSRQARLTLMAGGGNERRIYGIVAGQQPCIATTARDLADQIILFLDDLITGRLKLFVILDGVRQVERDLLFEKAML